MNIIIPCPLCRKDMGGSHVEAGEAFIFRCGCGVVTVIQKDRYNKVNNKAKVTLVRQQITKLRGGEQ